MSESNDTVITSHADRVLTVTLNRPERLNALTTEMVVKLHDIVTDAAKNPDVGAVVLTGAGTAFCAGGDFKPSDEPRTHTTEEAMQLGAALVFLLHDMPKPSIAIVNGAAAGGGLALVLGCDLRICADTARLTFAYPKIGLSGDFGANYLLHQLLGAGKAREFCLLSPMTSADEAMRLGLAHRVFPAASTLQQGTELARELANGPTFAFGAIKANLNAAARLPRTEAVRLETENFLHCRETEEHKAIVRARFAQKPGKERVGRAR